MDKIIERKNITEDTYREILDVETHHDHPITQDPDGTLRWRENHLTRQFLEKIPLNELVMLLRTLGYDKNSEPYRNLYRNMGYSLFGYWEVFYWEVNNEAADDYKPSMAIKLESIPSDEKAYEMVVDHMDETLSVKTYKEVRKGVKSLMDAIRSSLT